MSINLAVAAAILLPALYFVNNARSRTRSTKLRGPPSPNPIVGVFAEIIPANEPYKFFEGLQKEFGAVFSIPMGIGGDDIVLCDLKAASHFLARATTVYQGSQFGKIFLENMFGKSILTRDGLDHRRIRRALSPAFSISAIREYIEVFNASCQKLCTSWDSLTDNGAAIIEVQQWMNNLSLDNLGIAGFSHEFGALDGNRPDIVDVFESFQSPLHANWLSKLVFTLALFFPPLLNAPTGNTKILRRIKYSMKDIADILLKKTKEELNGLGDETASNKSIIGLLIKAETSNGGLSMTSEEVLAQNTLFFAGYESTSISLTWALIELCRHPRVQDTLRAELKQLQGSEPTMDELSSLPYLNAVIKEVLRTHATVISISRVAAQDDIIPLSRPVTTANGELVTELVVAKGTQVHFPMACIDLSEELWGPDAKEFNPDRWMRAELPPGAQAIPGYHQVAAFSDGPRMCLGRHFAVANMKTTLANLVRRYTFELPNGTDTELGDHPSFTKRPKIVGEDGARVPLRVERVE